MARRPADQTVDRADILTAAAGVLHRNGYEATTMKDIAAQVDLTAASLYHHFRNKDLLLLNVLENGLDYTIDQLEAIEASDCSFAEKLAAMVRAHIECLTGDLSLGTAMVFEVRALLNVRLNGDPSSHGEFLQRRARYFARRAYFESLFYDTVVAGIAAGEFRSVDADIMTKQILGAHNWVPMWFREGGRLDREQVANRMVDTWLAALQA